MIVKKTASKDVSSKVYKKVYCTFGAQSFTSFKADLRQDIKGSFAFASAIKEHLHEGSALLRLW